MKTWLIMALTMWQHKTLKCWLFHKHHHRQRKVNRSYVLYCEKCQYPLSLNTKLSPMTFNCWNKST